MCLQIGVCMTLYVCILVFVFTNWCVYDFVCVCLCSQVGMCKTLYVCLCLCLCSQIGVCMTLYVYVCVCVHKTFKKFNIFKMHNMYYVHIKDDIYPVSGQRNWYSHCHKRWGIYHSDHHKQWRTLHCGYHPTHWFIMRPPLAHLSIIEYILYLFELWT